MRLIRPALLILALAVCAWFVIGIRQAHSIGAATSIVEIGRAAGPRKLAVAAEDLRSAAFLNPDQTVNILRARLAIIRGQLSHAQQILLRVTQNEPLNLEAWIWFTGASLGNSHEARIGTARIAQLDPIDARPVKAKR